LFHCQKPAEAVDGRRNGNAVTRAPTLIALILREGSGGWVERVSGVDIFLNLFGSLVALVDM
jgi:hypothetical protein